MIWAAAPDARSQTTWYVDVQNGGCPGSGTAADPFCTIQSGIDAAVDGDLVLVRPGTYMENLDFKCKRITVRSDVDGDVSTPDPDPTVTIVDGSAPANPNFGSVVLFRCIEDRDSVLQGFTLRGGTGTLIGGRFYGGGICCYGTSPTIDNNVIDSNSVSAGTGGGIACIFSASPAITASEISNNNAQVGAGISCEYDSSAAIERNAIHHNGASYAQGGGVRCLQSDAFVSGNAITSNTGAGIQCLHSNVVVECNNISYNTTIAEGGAISTDADSEMTITDNVIVGNYASNYAGAVLFYYGTLVRNRIEGNSAVNHGGGVYAARGSQLISDNDIMSNSTGANGGGIYIPNGDSPIVRQNRIIGNQAGLSGLGAGGGIYCMNTNVTIDGNFIQNNIADDRGGGMYVHASSAPISNNLIVRNSATLLGGGIYLSSSSVDITRNTIVNNISAFTGGGVICDNSSPRLVDSILWGNAPDQITDCPDQINGFGITFTDVQGGWPGNGNIDVDPLFLDAPNDDYHLQESSPCINAGDPDSAPDLDGTRADMGALPFDNPPPPVISSVSPDHGPSRGGNVVRITGDRLTATAIVTFGGRAADQIFYVSPTELDAVAPPRFPVGSPGGNPSRGGLAVDITVTTNTGSSTLPSAYTYIPSKR